MQIHKKIKILFAVLVLTSFPIALLAATNDFIADSNITVSGVTFGSITTDMLIFSGSTAENWLFNGGAFTVTNPGTAFRVGSSNSAVKSIHVSLGGSTLVCNENITAGTSYATLPITSGTYTINPSSVAQCTSLCAVLSNTATYNVFPTCGALTCSAGYQVSGSGAGATCVPNTTGATLLPSCSTGYMLSAALQCIPIVSAVVPTIATGSTQITSTRAVVPSATFTKNLFPRMMSDDVRRLQVLLASDKELYPEGIITGYYGQLTKKAVGKFQIKYGVVASAKTPGYGNVGPLTRAKLQRIFGK